MPDTLSKSHTLEVANNAVACGKADMKLSSVHKVTGSSSNDGTVGERSQVQSSKETLNKFGFGVVAGFTVLINLHEVSNLITVPAENDFLPEAFEELGAMVYSSDFINVLPKNQEKQETLVEDIIINHVNISKHSSYDRGTIA
ncbi:hypothetical protein STEG23_030167 [Scotinomys teguina]